MKMQKVVLALSLGAATAQQPPQVVEESHLAIDYTECYSVGSCETNKRFVAIDANWRWVEEDGQNCFKGNSWDSTFCPSTEEGAKECAENCAVEGATYEESYGITTDGSALTVDFVTMNNAVKQQRKGLGAEENLTNVGSRTYLVSEDDTTYQMFKLKNREFTFTVDDSQLPCGLNGALYFVEMSADGGLSNYSGNAAGSKYGTGYCDAQCPHDIKFINGEANVLDWVPSDTDPNAGTGKYGSCCTEMDIWEANQVSSAYTPHTCSVVGQTRCEGAECGDVDDSNPNSRYEGVCDKDGCDFNPYRYNVDNFYGAGENFAVNTLKPITVVTQFITTDGTDTGDLAEIRRLYVQDGQVINNPSVNVTGASGVTTSYDSVTDAFCADSRAYFNETHNDFKENGGMKGMGDALDRGMVLVMSLWDDHYANMLWLDSTYPTDSTTQGAARGTCATDSGAPADVEANAPDSKVTFSDIKFGVIGSTY